MSRNVVSLPGPQHADAPALLDDEQAGVAARRGDVDGRREAAGDGLQARRSVRGGRRGREGGGREDRDGTHPRMVPSACGVPSPPQRGGQMAPSMRSTASAAGGKPAPRRQRRDHPEGRHRRVERVLGARGVTGVRAVERGVEALQVRRPRAGGRLAHRAREAPRIDLDDARPAVVVERPDGEAGPPQRQQVRHAAHAAGADRARAADLEDRLRRRERELREPQVRRQLRSPLARAGPTTAARRRAATARRRRPRAPRARPRCARRAAPRTRRHREGEVEPDERRRARQQLGDEVRDQLLAAAPGLQPQQPLAVGRRLGQPDQPLLALLRPRPVHGEHAHRRIVGAAASNAPAGVPAGAFDLTSRLSWRGPR